MLRYLVLGDMTVVLDTTSGFQLIADQRVSATATAERQEADQHLIGSPAKLRALTTMKHAELAARNRPGGYWIAAANPAAIDHALIGEVAADSVRRFAVLTDGAARTVDLFQLYGSWLTALDDLERVGAQEFIRRIRALEASDPRGAAYPRNKVSDDATVVVVRAVLKSAERTPMKEERPLRPLDERIALANELLARTVGAYGDGMAQRIQAERRAGAV